MSQFILINNENHQQHLFECDVDLYDTKESELQWRISHLSLVVNEMKIKLYTYYKNLKNVIKSVSDLRFYKCDACKFYRALAIIES